MDVTSKKLTVLHEDEAALDGVSPYHARIPQYLDQTFPGQWIGRRGIIELPLRSPDLSSL